MEQVELFCLRCNAELGIFTNSFDSIESTYFSPCEPSTGIGYGFETTGDTYHASSGSQMENCVLQDLECKVCKTLVGLRCESAPEGHTLRKHQLLLRLAQILVMNTENRFKAVVSLKEKSTLTISSTKNLPKLQTTSSNQPTQAHTSSSLLEVGTVKGHMLHPPMPGPSYDSIQRDISK